MVGDERAVRKKKIEENKNLTNKVNELQLEINKLQKEIEELKAAEGKVIEETAKWKTYRNEKYGFEIKYPGEWKVIDKVFQGIGQVSFLKDSSSNAGFSIGINIFVDHPILVKKFPSEDVIVESVKASPSIYTIHKPKGTIVYLDMCFKENKEYLGNYCQEVKREGDYYQFSIFCEEEEWRESEGIIKCNRLFNQIVSTFKFIK